MMQWVPASYYTKIFGYISVGGGENITAIDEGAPDTLDFLKNISIFHWVLGTAWIPLLAFCCALFYFIRRHQ